MDYRKITTGTAIVFVLSLASSASVAKYVQPSGQYIGEGTGPVFYQGSRLLGSRNEVWSLNFPTATATGSVTIRARSHPRPDVDTDWYSNYTLTNAPINIFGTAYPQTTWDPATCTGTITIGGDARIRWTGSTGVTPPQSEPPSTFTMQSVYIYTSTNSGNNVTFTVVNQINGFAPNFSIHLARP
jgi:hypothetical protein